MVLRLDHRSWHPYGSELTVAEAAKVIENTQRDLNIALVNEPRSSFARWTSTPWMCWKQPALSGLLPFRPAGGRPLHRRDPYYLTHKAEELGYHSQVVLSGRRINDGMGRWVVEQLVLEMARRGMVIAGAKVLVLGLSFKENCPDLRNTRVVDLIEALQRYGMETVLVDPCIDPAEAQQEYGLTVSSTMPALEERFAAVVAAVPHRQFARWTPEQWRQLLLPSGVLLDLKGIVLSATCADPFVELSPGAHAALARMS